MTEQSQEISNDTSEPTAPVYGQIGYVITHPNLNVGDMVRVQTVDGESWSSGSDSGRWWRITVRAQHVPGNTGSWSVRSTDVSWETALDALGNVMDDHYTSAVNGAFPVTTDMVLGQDSENVRRILLMPQAFIDQGRVGLPPAWLVIRKTLAANAARMRSLDAQAAASEREVAQAWLSDLDTFAEALKTEADRRGWCSEYDEWVESTQASMRRFTIPQRAKEYEVRITHTVQVCVEQTITVEATSAEAAVEEAHEIVDDSLDTSDVIQALRDGAAWSCESDDCELA